MIIAITGETSRWFIEKLCDFSICSIAFNICATEKQNKRLTIKQYKKIMHYNFDA